MFLNIKKINKKINDNKKFLFSQGYFNTDINTNGELKLINKIIKQKKYFIDIGSNVGKISNYVLKKKKNLFIHMFDILDKNVIKVNLQNNYVSYHQKIVSDKHNSYQYIYKYFKKNNLFDFSEVNSVFKRTDYNLKDKNQKKIRYKTINLDTFFKKLKNKKIFLKIDSEGSEIKIFNGAKKFLQNNDVDGYFEYNPDVWRLGNLNYKDAYRFFFNENYDLYRITPLGLKKIDYYQGINEHFFCYYFFSKSNLEKKYGFKKKVFSRKLGKKNTFIYPF